MIAAESAIFVTLDIVLSPSFVRRRRCGGTPEKIDKRSRYSQRGETGASFQITFHHRLVKHVGELFLIIRKRPVTFPDVHLTSAWLANTNS
jgi:hypothetical protein